LKDFHQKYSNVPLEKCEHLPNGYDSADFPRLDLQKNEKFTVTYTGSMYGKRNPGTFLNAVAELVSEGTVDVNKICLRFAGRFGTEVHKMFENDLLKDCIEVHSYLPHSESIRLLLQSDALLMIVDEYVGNEEIVPGKVFEYLGAHRPIITIAPEGAVAELIRETSSGSVARHYDLNQVRNIFLEYYTNFLYNETAFWQDLEKVKLYERREITRQLAGLLDEVTNPGKG
jgi:glycosyltransferase involved in cell wall biosynthesis